MADVTKVLIKMCREAKELQKIWKTHPGDFAFCPWMETPDVYDGQYSHTVLTNDYKDKYLKGEAIWIPRMDQLIKMFDLPITVLWDGFHKWMKGDARFIFSSIEQFLLGYLMLKKYNKEWTGKKWERIKNARK